MKVGFTGTRQGMTDEQQYSFAKEFIKLNPTELHHGDCQGADEQAHDIVLNRLYIISHAFSKSKTKIVIHPPDNPSKRAYKRGDIHLAPLPYLERNRAIVNDTDMLIACPKEMIEERRSGTWATIRFARSKGKPIVYIYPDGTIAQEKYFSREEDF